MNLPIIPIMVGRERRRRRRKEVRTRPILASLSDFDATILCQTTGDMNHERVKEKVMRRFFFKSLKGLKNFGGIFSGFK